MTVTVKCPSGATLKITPSPFAVSKALYQALLKELRTVRFDFTDQVELYKQLFCVGFSSPEIERCLWECFKRCTYNSDAGDLKITEDTFEPEKAREDYMTVCTEVAKVNIVPFAKNLFAEYERFSEILSTDSPK
jgi:hypothetical protein